MAETPTPTPRRGPLTQLRWYYFTRGLGAVAFLYELVGDVHSTDRATIIIAACGLMGLDKVARSDASEKR